jgi:hypothetical protein
MAAAWHSAALPLSKRFPPLRRFLGVEERRKVQTTEEMLAAMRGLVAATRHLA